jgi:hypothetical protein
LETCLGEDVFGEAKEQRVDDGEAGDDREQAETFAD